MMISPDRLKAFLKPQGFSLRHVDLGDIPFVRPSSIPRLHEHLIVYGQGKRGEAAYATTSVSGSDSVVRDPCVAEVDHALLYTLQTDTNHHWTIVNNRTEAVEWEKALARHADSHCRATTQTHGPSLSQRLQPTFAVVDRYIERLGNFRAIFDSEYQYISQASQTQRDEAARLALGISGSWAESSGDTELACLVLDKFATEVEGREAPFRQKKPYEEPCLRVRIYLLVDFIRDMRRLYLKARDK